MGKKLLHPVKMLNVSDNASDFSLSLSRSIVLFQCVIAYFDRRVCVVHENVQLAVCLRVNLLEKSPRVIRIRMIAVDQPRRLSAALFYLCISSQK